MVFLAFLLLCASIYFHWELKALASVMDGPAKSIDPLPDPLYLAFLQGGLPEVLRFSVFRVLSSSLLQPEDKERLQQFFQNPEPTAEAFGPPLLASEASAPKKPLRKEEKKELARLSSLEKSLLHFFQTSKSPDSLAHDRSLLREAKGVCRALKREAQRDGLMFSDVAAFFFRWSFMGVLFFAIAFFFALFEPHTAKNASFLFIFGLLAVGGVTFFLFVGIVQQPPRLAPRGKRYLSDLRFAYELFRDPQRPEEDLTQEMKLFLFALFGPALALGQASLFAEKIVSFQRGSSPYDGCSSLATLGGGCGSDGCGGGERGGGGCGGGDSGGGESGGGCGGGGCGGGGCGGGGD